jgi:hypothetical protein
MELPLSLQGTKVLLVGTGSYESDEIPDVGAISRTLRDLGELLVQRCGLAPENLTILHDPKSVSEIGSALVVASEAASEALLVYFVGHGLVHSSGELYLAHARTSSRPTAVAFTALRYSSVRECLLNSPARAIYVLLDCCFAGRAIGTLAPSSVVDRTRVDGACVMAATARDELALAPADAVYTAFTGELISYLREGDPRGSEYLRFRDAFRHLASALPAKNCPAPSYLANQNADDLVLCRNAAFAGEVGKFENELAPEMPGAPELATARVSDGLGEIVQYSGWVDFNPLPAALTEVDSRVPRTSEQLAELLADHPPNWEARLFAGTALQELVRLRRSYVKHFRGPFIPSGIERSGQLAFDYIREELSNYGTALERLDTILRNDRHREIIDSADSRRIQAHARELTDTIEQFMQISDRLRSVSILNRHLRRAANLLAHFADQPIISITQFVQKYITELDHSGRKIMDGEDLNINLSIELEIPEVLSREFGDAMSRY